jgi:tRNA(fMet)-specific endonuclease VapC
VSFLLDTDVCSAYLKGDKRVGNRCLQYGGRLSISVISAAELYAWTLRSTARAKTHEALLAFLSGVPLLTIDDETARMFGELRAQQFDSGRLTPAMDLLIASTALQHGLTLVTHNTKDFVAVPGLTTIDWLQE